MSEESNSLKVSNTVFNRHLLNVLTVDESKLNLNKTPSLSTISLKDFLFSDNNLLTINKSDTTKNVLDLSSNIVSNINVSGNGIAGSIANHTLNVTSNPSLSDLVDVNLNQEQDYDILINKDTTIQNGKIQTGEWLTRNNVDKNIVLNVNSSHLQENIVPLEFVNSESQTTKTFKTNKFLVHNRNNYNLIQVSNTENKFNLQDIEFLNFNRFVYCTILNLNSNDLAFSQLTDGDNLNNVDLFSKTNVEQRIKFNVTDSSNSPVLKKTLIPSLNNKTYNSIEFVNNSGLSTCVSLANLQNPVLNRNTIDFNYTGDFTISLLLNINKLTTTEFNKNYYNILSTQGNSLIHPIKIRVSKELHTGIEVISGESFHIPFVNNKYFFLTIVVYNNESIYPYMDIYYNNIQVLKNKIQSSEKYQGISGDISVGNVLYTPQTHNNTVKMNLVNLSIFKEKLTTHDIEKLNSSLSIVNNVNVENFVLNNNMLLNEYDILNVPNPNLFTEDKIVFKKNSNLNLLYTSSSYSPTNLSLNDTNGSNLAFQADIFNLPNLTSTNNYLNISKGHVLKSVLDNNLLNPLNRNEYASYPFLIELIFKLPSQTFTTNTFTLFTLYNMHNVDRYMSINVDIIDNVAFLYVDTNLNDNLNEGENDNNSELIISNNKMPVLIDVEYKINLLITRNFVQLKYTKNNEDEKTLYKIYSDVLMCQKNTNEFGPLLNPTHFLLNQKTIYTTALENFNNSQNWSLKSLLIKTY